MKCILILEDEPLIAMDLQLAFEDAGAEAVVTVSCDEAFEAMDGAEFDGAVLDVNLGKGETCEPVAVELRARGVPFLLHTGDLDRHIELDDFLTPQASSAARTSYPRTAAATAALRLSARPFIGMVTRRSQAISYSSGRPRLSFPTMTKQGAA